MVIFLIILLLFFIPFPLIIKVHFSSNLYYVKIFNFNIVSSTKNISNKLISKIKDTKFKSSKSKASISNKKKKLSIKKLNSLISTNKFKPKFTLKGNLDFSLEDAAMTAINYGLICNLQAVIIILLKKLFNIKKFNINTTPKFTGKNLLNFTISSIIYINIAQIIYILYLIYISLEKIEEVSPE